MKFTVFYYTSLLIAVCVPAAAEPGYSRDYHCAHISTVKTLHFGIEAVPDEQFAMTADLYHTDIDVSFAFNGWDIRIDNDVYGHQPPAKALLYLDENARLWLDPMPANLEFIGAQAGQVFWYIPQSSVQDSLWLGFAAERAHSGHLCQWNPGDPRGADESDRWFRIKLRQVRGPDDGHVSLWQTLSGGRNIVFMSTYDGGITSDDVYYIADGWHSHVNWAFTKPGEYEIDVEISTMAKCHNLAADLWPVASQSFRGNCRVNFKDFAVMAENWLRDDCDYENCHYANMPAEPHNQVSSTDLMVLAEQWLTCGYPGCDD